MKIYCPHIYINQPELLKSRGPILLACNHPNSFLDGMILTTLFDRPVYSLARGDVFKKAWIRKLLLWGKLLPVYRTSEGAENLGHNYSTFKVCQSVFKKESMVIIFSEANSVNEWHLRPLRKGTARLAISSWQNGINLKVVPVALNYNSFEKFGKAIHIYFGEQIMPEEVMIEASTGKQLLTFNRLLHQQLKHYVYEIPETDYAAIQKKFYVPYSRFHTAVLLLPALVGLIAHWPVYSLIKLFTASYFKKSDHYDSVLIGLLMITYPIYLFLHGVLLFLFFNLSIALFGVLLLPFFAWALAHIKYQWSL